MKAQQRLDKVLEPTNTKIQDEVSALMGVTFELAPSENQLVSKEDCFLELTDKQIVAKMDITGEIEGSGCLLIGVKDAIRLGGTLIMLPPAELEEVIRNNNYNEETEDSYGEIANIIAGSYTKVFEDMYPDKCRFVRKEQEVLAPMKVDIESDTPVPNQMYYQVSSSMKLDDAEMGNIVMLIPAAAFGIETEGAQPEKVEEEIPVETVETVQEPAPQEDVQEETQIAETPKPKVLTEALDKVLEPVNKTIQDEVSALIGVTFKLSPSENQLLSKEDCFYQKSGKQVVAKMDITGEIEGSGCLLVDVKDAIRLGGTLVMIPPAELEKIVLDDKYDEEIEDSYGEIANIIAGSYTKVFEEMYPDKCRFVRKEQELLVPLKVDIESDEPVPNQVYYQVSASMKLDDAEMGTIAMLIPAEAFGIETEGAQQVKAEAESPAETVETIQEPPTKPQVSTEDVETQRKRIDGMLETCQQKVGEEVGALLGVEVQLSDQENRPVTKEDYFFEEAVGKQVVAYMDVIDDKEDKSYLFVDMKDAIRIGGVLIMLPPTEIDVAVTEDDFSVDAEDAYGEIANIISGVYTSVFQEKYSKNIRFVKTDLEEVTPMKVKIDTAEPFPDELYYMSSSQLAIDDKDYGKVQMLFPAAMLGLEALGLEKAPEVASTKEEGVAQPAVAANAEKPLTPGTVPVSGDIKDADILVIGDDETELLKISNYLDTTGLAVTTLSFQDNVNAYITDGLKVVMLVMRDVDEQSFGAVIKVSSACSAPLIAAGPGWTRTKVIKAVKYGVNDILLTPATNDEIKEKIESNMVQLAA